METRQRSGNEFDQLDQKEGTVRYEIEGYDFAGTVEWEGPGQVKLEMPDGPQKQWFERYFETQDSVMGGAGEPMGMTLERRNETEAAFNRAAYQLAAYAYTVRQGDGRRHEAHPQRAAG